MVENTKFNGDISEEVAKILGIEGEIENLEEEMNIIIDERKQYTMRIPKKFAELCRIKKTDKFLFKLIPPEEQEGQFSITAELKRG